MPSTMRSSRSVSAHAPQKKPEQSPSTITATQAGSEVMSNDGRSWLRTVLPSLFLTGASVVLCMLLFLGLTRAYFDYRIAARENASNSCGGRNGIYSSGSGDRNNDDDDCRGGSAVPTEPGSPSAVRRGSKVTVNTVYIYENTPYFILRPYVRRVNETVLNPQLVLLDGPQHSANAKSAAAASAALSRRARNASSRADILEWERNVRVAEARRTTPTFRRYLLTDTKPGQRYMLRVSFLGSPSVGYRTYLYHVRRSALRFADDEETRWSPAAPQRRKKWTRSNPESDERISHQGDEQGEHMALQFKPLDTEVVTITMHDRFASQYAEDTDLVYDAKDLHAKPKASSAGEHENDDDDAFTAVVEVMPYVFSLAADPRDFVILTYNIDLIPFTWNMVPDIAIPLIVSMSLLAMGLGGGVLYPWLIDAVIRSADGDQLAEDGDTTEANISAAAKRA